MVSHYTSAIFSAVGAASYLSTSLKSEPPKKRGKKSSTSKKEAFEDDEEDPRICESIQPGETTDIAIDDGKSKFLFTVIQNVRYV
jgi:hypothetical protein